MPGAVWNGEFRCRTKDKRNGYTQSTRCKCIQSLAAAVDGVYGSCTFILHYCSAYCLLLFKQLAGQLRLSCRYKLDSVCSGSTNRIANYTCNSKLSGYKSRNDESGKKLKNGIEPKSAVILK